MRIVLTNDDGFGSLGIETVREIVKEFGEVFVFAPSSPQSGMSCGFTTYRKPITVHKVDDHNFKVDGTPVDCVLFANAYLQGNYDMIISGCNHGYNMSNDTMYSGTCGACAQGLVFKKKCIAFSADQFEDDKHIKEYIPKVFKFLLEKDLLSGDFYWNVNLHPESARMFTYFCKAVGIEIFCSAPRRKFIKSEINCVSTRIYGCNRTVFAPSRG